MFRSIFKRDRFPVYSLRDEAFSDYKKKFKNHLYDIDTQYSLTHKISSKIAPGAVNTLVSLLMIFYFPGSSTIVALSGITAYFNESLSPNEIKNKIIQFMKPVLDRLTPKMADALYVTIEYFIKSKERIKELQEAYNESGNNNNEDEDVTKRKILTRMINTFIAKQIGENFNPAQQRHIFIGRYLQHFNRHTSGFTKKEFPKYYEQIVDCLNEDEKNHPILQQILRDSRSPKSTYKKLTKNLFEKCLKTQKKCYQKYTKHKFLDIYNENSLIGGDLDAFDALIVLWWISLSPHMRMYLYFNMHEEIFQNVFEHGGKKLPAFRKKKVVQFFEPVNMINYIILPPLP